jgi:hypothetical protein
LRLLGCDPFLQQDDLEAALPLGLTGRRGLALAAGLYRLLDLARFHDGTSFQTNTGLRYKEKAIIPGAQTERRGEAGLMRIDRVTSLHRAVETLAAALATARGDVMPNAALIGRDPLLQLDDLEAALPLGLTGRRGLALAAGLYRLLDLARFHDGTSFQTNTGLRYKEKAIVPGAQTERRGEAGPVRLLLDGKDSPAAFRVLRLFLRGRLKRGQTPCPCIDSAVEKGQNWYQAQGV